MLFVGDDWAEDHHDVELVDEAGTVLARRRLPEGQVGVTRLHALIAEHLPDPAGDLDPVPRVMVGIETERGPWVASLVAAGYTVYAINPLSAARYRQRHSTSGAKSDAADAHLLAEIVRVDRAHHRAVAVDSALAEGDQARGPHAPEPGVGTDPARAAAALHAARVLSRCAAGVCRARRHRHPGGPGCGPGPGHRSPPDPPHDPYRSDQGAAPQPSKNAPTRSWRRCGRRSCANQPGGPDRLRRDRAQPGRLIATLNTQVEKPSGRWWPTILAVTRR